MRSVHLRWPSTTAVSLLAGLATWVALFSWTGLVERASGYLMPGFMVCLIVAVGGMLMRSARVPFLLVPWGQAALLLLWVTRSWASDLAWFGWIPSPDSLREVAARVGEGLTVAQAYAAPVPENVPAIHALLIAGVAGTALVVDFLACGIRRVPLTGLPLLAVYTVPVGILDEGVSWVVFATGALVFLSLMAADEAQRLIRWGRQISGSGRVFDSVGTTVSTQAVRSSARKIGLTATGLAVVVPIFIPTVGAGMFQGGGSGGGGAGGSVSISNPIADLQRDLVRGEDIDLVWVTTKDPDPSYLRISVLDFFDGETWKPSGRDIPVEQRANGRMPKAPGLEPDVRQSETAYSIQIGSDFESRWLPTPYPVSFITTQGDWRYDTSTLDFISAADGQTTQNADYSLRALTIEPTAQQLVSAAPSAEEVFTPYTALPASMPGSMRRIAREVTEAQPSNFEKAVRLQDWFRGDGGFTYSTARPDGNGLDDLEQFLGNGPDSRVGYCEQFAAAMALMGRSIGIPSRVAVGFLRPTEVDDETYVYSAHDLHAWPEMYFQGTGWVRFEPTPSSRAAAVPGYTSEGLPSAEPAAPAASANPGVGANRPDRETQVPGAGGPTDGGGGGSALGGSLQAFAVLLVLLVLAVGPRLARTVVRRRRAASATTSAAVAEAAWSELRDTALDLRLPWDDSVTLRSRARTLVQSFGEPAERRTPEVTGPRTPTTGRDANPEATQALERLVKHVERARYARSVPERSDVFDDLHLCTTALTDGASAKRRLAATWLPASLVTSLGGVLLRREGWDDQAAGSDLGVDHAV